MFPGFASWLNELQTGWRYPGGVVLLVVLVSLAAAISLRAYGPLRWFYRLTIGWGTVSLMLPMLGVTLTQKGDHPRLALPGNWTLLALFVLCLAALPLALRPERSRGAVPL